MGATVSIIKRPPHLNTQNKIHPEDTGNEQNAATPQQSVGKKLKLFVFWSKSSSHRQWLRVERLARLQTSLSSQIHPSLPSQIHPSLPSPTHAPPGSNTTDKKASPCQVQIKFGAHPVVSYTAQVRARSPATQHRPTSRNSAKQKTSSVFQVKQPWSKFLNRFSSEKMQEQLTKVEVLKHIQTDDSIYISFQGKAKHVKLAQTLLETMKQQLVTYRVKLEQEFPDRKKLQQVKKMISTNVIRPSLDELEPEIECVIDTHGPNITLIFDNRHETALYSNTRLSELYSCVGQMLWAKVKPVLSMPRGTVEFLGLAAQKDDVPPYWRCNMDAGSSSISLDSTHPLVYVGRITREAITDLVFQTFDQSSIGVGRDARGLRHNSIQVVSVQRVENQRLFKIYNDKRKRMCESMYSKRRLCKPVDQLLGSRGAVRTTDVIQRFMKKELYTEINEHYLFHGTKANLVDAVLNNGLDPRVGGSHCMLGKGIYTAEMVTKSDQYTDSQTSRGQDGVLLLMRVLLGDVYVISRNSPYITGPEKLTRPPCVQCQKDRCSCPNQVLYDSVMLDGGAQFREFVVYDRDQCYPEYVIKYRRIVDPKN
ncbi:uncharacterized protein LOC131953627 [Physella acuta]|uniref:uncharacterized protein LOC131953627 n=1 Tax=Physella acuta TaxID=109671 RepID=UPI0027DE61F0|nr:uncharacterized protein LOC131953627 [Physella acuta]XP_059172883.1 uncharacterized protein LOC131953627 [Physella acuta]